MLGLNSLEITAINPRNPEEQGPAMEREIPAKIAVNSYIEPCFDPVTAHSFRIRSALHPVVPREHGSF